LSSHAAKKTTTAKRLEEVGSPKGVDLSRAPRFDCRVHFALNFGTLSSPSLRVYTPFNVFDLLEAQTRAYMNQFVQVNHDSKQIFLPKILCWFFKDFNASAPEKTLKVLKNYLNPELQASLSKDYRIQFKEYGWTFYYSFQHFAEMN
jgi:hypothetical protein